MADKGKLTNRPTKADKKLAAATSAVEELTTQVKTLRTRVKELEVESKTWHKRAVKQKSRVNKIRGKAEKAIADAAKVRTKARKAAKARHVIADHPRAEPMVLMGAPDAPQPAWTVAQLRIAAKDQGVAGYSRMRKDQLLDALI